MELYPIKKKLFKELLNRERNTIDMNNWKSNEEIWNKLIDTVRNVHEDIVSQRSRNPVRKGWLSTEAWQLIEQQKV